MPKKTKRQKQIADLHRHLPYSPSVSTPPVKDFKIEQPVFQLNKIVSAKKQESLTDDATELKVVKTDLYKTINRRM